VLDRPATVEEVIAGTARHRTPCGGSVERPVRYYDDLWFADEEDADDGDVKLTCSKCRQVWRVRSLKAFTARDITDRFYFAARPATNDTHALVWITDPVSKRRHMSTVPLSKAEGMERVKL
jgi:hypothetical protein